MGIAGALIGIVRDIVRDIIAMTLAGIIKAAIVAVALAPVTFGGSIIAAVTSEMLKILAKTRGKADEVVKLTLNGNLDKIKVPKPKPYTGSKPPAGDAPGGGPQQIEDTPGSGDHTPDNNQVPKPGEDRPDGKKPDNPLATEKPDKLGDIATWVVRDKLAKMPDATPELMKKFDYWSSMPMPELVKTFGKNAEVLEKAVKLMSDPTYGAPGMAGKIIIDMMKSIPPAATETPPQ